MRYGSLLVIGHKHVASLRSQVAKSQFRFSVKTKIKTKSSSEIGTKSEGQARGSPGASVLGKWKAHTFRLQLSVPGSQFSVKAEPRRRLVNSIRARVEKERTAPPSRQLRATSHPNKRCLLGTPRRVGHQEQRRPSGAPSLDWSMVRIAGSGIGVCDVNGKSLGEFPKWEEQSLVGE